MKQEIVKFLVISEKNKKRERDYYKQCVSCLDYQFVRISQWFCTEKLKFQEQVSTLIKEKTNKQTKTVNIVK